MQEEIKNTQIDDEPSLFSKEELELKPYQKTSNNQTTSIYDSEE